MKISDVLQHNPCSHGMKYLMYHLNLPIVIQEKLHTAQYNTYEEFIKQMTVICGDYEFTYEELFAQYDALNDRHRSYLGWLLLKVPYGKLEEELKRTHDRRENSTSYTASYYYSNDIALWEIINLAIKVSKQ